MEEIVKADKLVSSKSKKWRAKNQLRHNLSVGAIGCEIRIHIICFP